VVRFLSAEWLTALDEAARELVVPDDVDLVVEQLVRGSDGGECAYHVVFGGGSVRVRPGRAEAATVAVQQSYATAVALARGELNAQQAMARGELRVAGDVALLSRHGRSLARLPDLFARVRERTEF
jgi:putative sterol carrier protein